MDTPKSALNTFVSAVRLGWHRGWNSDFSRANRRLQALLVSFQGYCAAVIFAISLIAVTAGRNIKGNLVGVAITGALAIFLIKLGKAIRRLGLRSRPKP